MFQDDLDRLLNLYESGERKTEEYELLHSHVLVDILFALKGGF
ncbi:hypothetical protein [Halobellus salinus]|nr:hypothetical protein [Halobellus salinus]